jgi:hypothetical protein
VITNLANSENLDGSGEEREEVDNEEESGCRKERERG